MKKYLILLVLLVIPFINASCLETGTINGIKYYEYKPSNASSSSKVIFAFHGIGSSTGDMANFGVYKQVESLSPNAVVVIPTKAAYGAWNASTYGNFVNTYLNQNGYSGSVGYYGFSQGAISGPGIINASKAFTSAVFVDEHFITYNGSVDSVYNNLSTLTNLKVFCGQHCDATSSLNSLSQKFSSAGKNMQVDSTPNNTHATMNSISVSPGLSFLTGASGSNPTQPTTIQTQPTSNVTQPGTTSPSPTTSSSSGSTTKAATTTKAGGGGDGEYTYCPLGDDVTQDLVGILRIMKILAPLLVVIYTIYEAVFAITQGKIEDESRKLFNKFTRRVAAALLLFAIPVLVDQLMQMMNVWDDKGHCTFEEKTTAVVTTESCRQRCDHIGDQAGRDACYKNCTTTKANNNSTTTSSTTSSTQANTSTTPAIIIINAE